MTTTSTPDPAHATILDTDVVPTEADAPDEDFARLGSFRVYVRRYMRNGGAVLGAIMLLILILLAVVGPHITPWSYSEPDFLALTEAPSANHWFGTTTGGNDVFASVLQGLSRSLVIAFAVSMITLVLSVSIGATAAYMGGRVETVTLAIIHFLLVVPSFLILAMISNSVGGDWKVLIVVLSIFGWMGSARVVWSVSTSLRERDYVKMAELQGVPKWKIISRHIIPNLGSLLIIQATLGVVGAVLTETSLSFLGFGIKPPDVSLGVMLQDGAASITTAPWVLLAPAIILIVLTVSVTLIGDGLRDAFDPTSNRSARPPKARKRKVKSQKENELKARKLEKTTAA